MIPLKLSATDDTPKVVLSTQENEFLISGRSLPENAYSFYKPIYDWLEQYSVEPLSECELHFSLDYFNTASAKQLSKIFSLLEIIKDNITIVWHYFNDDIDMENTGKRYERLTKLTFNFVEEISNNNEDDGFKIIFD